MARPPMVAYLPGGRGERSAPPQELKQRARGYGGLHFRSLMDSIHTGPRGMALQRDLPRAGRSGEPGTAAAAAHGNAWYSRRSSLMPEIWCPPITLRFGAADTLRCLQSRASASRPRPRLWHVGATQTHLRLDRTGLHRVLQLASLLPPLAAVRTVRGSARTPRAAPAHCGVRARPLRFWALACGAGCTLARPRPQRLWVASPSNPRGLDVQKSCPGVGDSVVE